MTAKQVARYFVLLNGLNDFAYFGFLCIHFTILESVLRTISPGINSTALSITLIVSQLFWQILAEAPTGAFADAFGRTRAITLSFVCRVLTMALISIAVAITAVFGDFSGNHLIALAAVILAQIIMGTGEAALVGSIEAWLVDECKHSGAVNHDEIADAAFRRSAVVQNLAILFAWSIFLGVWYKVGESCARFPLILFAASVCTGAGLICHRLTPLERHPRSSAANGVCARISAKITEAVRLARGADAAPMRGLVAILILPFPCWVLLSWFFSGFTQRPGFREDAALGAEWLFWIGFTLGIARLLGAWIAAKINPPDRLQTLRRLFGPVVALNLCLLFAASLALTLFTLGAVNLALLGRASVFLVLAALAKGSEEVVKLLTNRIFAKLVLDDPTRATTLSLVSVAQNAFGFVTIVVASCAFFWASSPGSGVIMVFVSCASVGLAAIGCGALTRVIRSLLRRMWAHHEVNARCLDDRADCQRATEANELSTRDRRTNG